MRHVVAKIILELAASDHALAEIGQFLKFAEDQGPQSMLGRIQHLRTSPALSLSDQENRTASRKTKAERRNTDVAREVETLLIHSANLSKSQATDILLSELIKRYDESELPSHNKVAFQTWLTRLADAVSPSELLHISSKVRNDIVHGNRHVSDWPISETR